MTKQIKEKLYGKEQNRNADKQIEEMNNKMISLNLQSKNFKKAIESISGIHSSLTYEQSEMKNQIYLINQTNNDHEHQENEILNKKIKNLEAENNSLKEYFKSLDKESKIYKEDHKHSNDEHNLLDRANTVVNEQILVHKTQLRIALAQVDELKLQAEDLKSEKEVKNNAKFYKQEEINRAKNMSQSTEIESLKDKLGEMTKQKDEYLQRYQNIKESNSYINNEYETLKGENLKHVNVHAENQRLIEHIERLEQNKLESQKIISEKPEMQAKISDLTKNNQAMEEEVLSLKEEISDLHRKNNVFSERIKMDEDQDMKIENLEKDIANFQKNKFHDDLKIQKLELIKDNLPATYNVEGFEMNDGLTNIERTLKEQRDETNYQVELAKKIGEINIYKLEFMKVNLPKTYDMVELDLTNDPVQFEEKITKQKDFTNAQLDLSNHVLEIINLPSPLSPEKSNGKIQVLHLVSSLIEFKHYGIENQQISAERVEILKQGIDEIDKLIEEYNVEYPFLPATPGPSKQTKKKK